MKFLKCFGCIAVSAISLAAIACGGDDNTVAGAPSNANTAADPYGANSGLDPYGAQPSNANNYDPTGYTPNDPNKSTGCTPGEVTTHVMMDNVWQDSCGAGGVWFSRVIGVLSSSENTTPEYNTGTGNATTVAPFVFGGACSTPNSLYQDPGSKDWYECSGGIWKNLETSTGQTCTGVDAIVKAGENGYPKNVCYKVVAVATGETNSNDYWFAEDMMYYNGSDFSTTMTSAQALNGATPDYRNSIQGICPSGYHVPLYDEWTDMFYDLLESNVTSYYCYTVGGGLYTAEDHYVCWGLVFGLNFVAYLDKYYWYADQNTFVVLPSGFPDARTKWVAQAPDNGLAHLRCKKN